MITYTRVPDGTWGIKVSGADLRRYAPGDHVSVLKRSGEVCPRVLGEVLARNKDGSLTFEKLEGCEKRWK